MFPDPVIIKADGRDVAVEDPGPGSGFPILMMNGSGSALAAAATMPDAIAAVCLFASVGPYGEPGLGFAEGLGEGTCETIRKFFEEPERARAEFRAQSAITLAERGSPPGGIGSW